MVFFAGISFSGDEDLKSFCSGESSQSFFVFHSFLFPQFFLSSFIMDVGGFFRTVHLDFRLKPWD